MHLIAVSISLGDLQQIASGQLSFAPTSQMTVTISKDFIHQAAAESGVTVALSNSMAEAPIYTEQQGWCCFIVKNLIYSFFVFIFKTKVYLLHCDLQCNDVVRHNISIGITPTSATAVVPSNMAVTFADDNLEKPIKCRKYFGLFSFSHENVY